MNFKTPFYRRPGVVVSLVIVLVGVGGIIVAHRGVQVHLESNKIAMFNQAVTHLGNTDSASVRLGGIYGLYNLLSLDPGRLQSIADILCAHLRETTQQEEYINEYEENPSDEVESLLKVLSLISKKFKRPDPDIPLLDMHDAYLSGANLKDMDLQGADLRGAWLQGADLRYAQLQGVDLGGAWLQGAFFVGKLPGEDLGGARLQGADLGGAWLQRVFLVDARLQGANLRGARLQGADLSRAWLHGADLQYARLQGADLRGARLQGADLFRAQLQGVNLWRAQLQGADLGHAQLHGADLRRARLYGADLQGTQLHGADLRDAQLQGAFSDENDRWRENLEEKINGVRGKDTSLETTLFGGGIEKSELDEIESNLKEGSVGEQRVREIIDRITPHVGRDANYTLPPESGAITGVLTDEMADEIIADYKKATQPKF